jgi:hypothetical protein
VLIWVSIFLVLLRTESVTRTEGGESFRYDVVNATNPCAT